MPQNIKKSKDDKNQMQRRLSNEITKSIKLCDFLLILLSGGELGSPPQELEFHGPVGPGNSSIWKIVKTLTQPQLNLS